MTDTPATFLFNFTLVPLDAVTPWGEPGARSLHWFGLTQGTYWIAAGRDLLLEYSDEERARSGLPRFCDYYVVRLYEDLLAMLPAILEPVPEDVTPWIARGRYEALRDWEPETETGWEARDLLLSVISARTLDVGYLSTVADIRLWSDARSVHIAWDNRGRLIDGLPAWSAVRGSTTLPRRMFESQVRSFHDRLMLEMAARVEQVCAGALPIDVQIDTDALRREHARRTTELEAATARPHQPTDWKAVRAAAACAPDSVVICTDRG